MRIGDVVSRYVNNLDQIIRVFKGDEMILCEYYLDMIQKMPRGEYERWMNMEFSTFRSNETVALHFYL